MDQKLDPIKIMLRIAPMSALIPFDRLKQPDALIVA
jgi:hypothetical protein